jgi:5-methylcytosine-specific restriction endonuclease McrA
VTTSTLLLNASYEPLRVINWQRAITLFLLGKIDVLETYDHLGIRTPREVFPWPAVARLRRRASWRNKGVRFSRQNVYRRDKYPCQYCKQQLSPRALTFDHVTPKGQGGRTLWDNIVTACVPCNQRKGNRTPEQAGMRLIREPRAPKWFQQDLVDGTSNLWKPYLWS